MSEVASQETVETPAPEPAGSTAPDGRSRPTRLVIVPLIMGLLFFFSPAAAGVLGDRAEPIDNRPLAAFPALSDGWNLIPGFTAWATDHLPLRSEAVAVGTALSERIFGEPPQYGVGGPNGPASVGVGGGAPQSGQQPKAPTYPDVIPGENGWLYFGGDVQSPCEPSMDVPDVIDGLTRLTEAVEGSGRKLVIGIAPDKSTIVPENLPDNYAGKECASERKSQFWSALTASSGISYVDPRAALEQAGESGEVVYRPQDSHWSPTGASVFVEQMISALDPGLLAPPTQFVDVGEHEFTGDLSVMLGKPETDPMTDVRVDRPGVTTSMDGTPIPIDEVPEATSSPAAVTNSTTQSPLLPGSTLVLGDSFYQGTRFLMTPFFEQLTTLHNETAGPYPELVGDLMAESDTVVVELVERSVSGGNVALVEPDVLSEIEKVLAEHPRK